MARLNRARSENDRNENVPRVSVRLLKTMQRPICLSISVTEAAFLSLSLCDTVHTVKNSTKEPDRAYRTLCCNKLDLKRAIFLTF